MDSVIGAERGATDGGKDDGLLETVEVVAMTTVTGTEQSRDQAVSSGQTASAAELGSSHAVDVSAYMVRRMAGVQVNEVQGNPLQTDLSYRGFTASPLLGTPQGLSVYLDGVRLNQPFGEVVSWDLIPKVAIARMDLLPTSNPLFGPNTQGGSIVLRTKDGRSYPGAVAELRYGTAKRRSVEFQAGGGSAQGWHAYVAGHRLSEDGWRDASPSDLRQGFAKLGWRSEAAEVFLIGAYAGSDLIGNGLQEERLLKRSWQSVYSQPDQTQNHARLVALGWKAPLSSLTWSGNMHYRNIDTATLNGDVNDDALGEALYQPNSAEQEVLQSAGYRAFPLNGETQTNTAFPFWRCIANVLSNEEPNEKCNGLLNRTQLDQSEVGGTLQLSWEARWFNRPLRVVGGLSASAARIRFLQSSQFGYLNSSHEVIPVAGTGAFADGTQQSESAFDARVELDGRIVSAGVYLASTYALSPATQLSFSARQDNIRVKNVDGITPTGSPGSLSATHSFERLNPALGITHSLFDHAIAYFSLSSGSRAPSAIELGCADPQTPCRLPNSMAGDPPLKQVVTNTFELGLRSTYAPALQWQVTLFRADSRDDILFVASEQSGFGYFRNVQATRRQGAELALAKSFDSLDVGLSYALVDATFQSDEALEGGSNSSNDATAPGFEGEIEIDEGDVMPLISRHLIKLNAEWRVTRELSVSVDGSWRSGMYARGNENNEHAPDGTYYLGRGKTDDYFLFNLGSEFKLYPSLVAFVQVDNVLGRRYATAAQLGPTAVDSAGKFVARPFAGPIIDGERPLRHSTFYAPGTPRVYNLGVRYSFGFR